jgi:glycerol dehydrogenase
VSDVAPPPGVRVFAAPGRYLQGPDALDELGRVLAGYGPRPLVVLDGFVRDLLGTRIDAILAAEGLTATYRLLDGEITPAAADRLSDLSGLPEESVRGLGVVVGVGGGKSLDAAKAVALRLGRPVVTVPTVASNDSPTSAAVAMYDDHHVMLSVDRLAQNPVAVVVDTRLVAEAPVAFLRAGLGDALAKKFEAEGCAAGTGVTPLGTRPLATGLAIADACYRTIRRHGAAGIRDCAAGVVGPDLEALVEAVVLMSGLGFENGGLSLAHSLTRGLMPARGAGSAMHGEHVAWALLVQRAVEGADDAELADLAGFLAEVGLPATLHELGLVAPSTEELAEIVRLTLAAPHLANLAVAVDAEDLLRAVDRIERLSPAG